MSDPDFTDGAAVASHSLAYLRRIDRQQKDVVELVTRQQDLFMRLEREMREGFARVDRDLKEIKGDILLIENRLLNRLSAEYELSSRIGELERQALAKHGAV